MADLFENPMELMGFEFIELASPEPGIRVEDLSEVGAGSILSDLALCKAWLAPLRPECNRPAVIFNWRYRVLPLPPN